MNYPCSPKVIKGDQSINGLTVEEMRLILKTAGLSSIGVRSTLCQRILDNELWHVNSGKSISPRIRPSSPVIKPSSPVIKQSVRPPLPKIRPDQIIQPVNRIIKHNKIIQPPLPVIRSNQIVQPIKSVRPPSSVVQAQIIQPLSVIQNENIFGVVRYHFRHYRSSYFNCV